MLVFPSGLAAWFLSHPFPIFCKKHTPSPKVQGPTEKEHVPTKFTPISHLPPTRANRSQVKTPVFPFALGKSRACWHHPPIHTHTNEELLRHSDSEKRVVNKNSPRRPQDAPGLEGFPVDCPGTIFFIFFLGNPHFLKGVQRGQDGATEERPRKQVRWTACGGPGFFSLPPTATVLEQCF